MRITVEQLEFIVEAFTVGKTFDKVKLSAAEAHEIMKEVGKSDAAVAKRFAGHPYFSTDLGGPRFARPMVLDVPKIKSYFGKSANALTNQLQRARARGEVDEEEGEEGDDDGDDGGDEAPRRRRKKRRGKSGGGGNGDHLREARAKLLSFVLDVTKATDGARGSTSTFISSMHCSATRACQRAASAASSSRG